MNLVSMPTLTRPVSSPTETLSQLAAADSPGDVSFQDLLAKAVGEVSQINTSARQRVEVGLGSDDLSLVETLSAMREADLALRMLMQIRNKLTEAYQEIQQLRM